MKHCETQSKPEFWSTEDDGCVTVLRFHEDAIQAGVDLQRISTLWDFFEDLHSGDGRVLLIMAPAGNLGPSALDHLWEYLRGIPRDEYLPSAREYRAVVEVAREDVTMQRAIAYLRDCRSFVVGAFEGRIDINLLGLLLACDFRIASENLVIENHVHGAAVQPGTAAPWFLSRLLGQSQALKVLLDCDRISAQQACELGMIHRITATATHERDSLNAAQELASKGVDRLIALKRAMVASERPLAEYFEVEGAGFVRPTAVRR